jgi:hypothetical protein
MLSAVSVMFNHMHLVVEAPAEVGKSELLRDFKSYASHRLNRVFGRPTSGTWWSESGSCRPLRHVPAAIFYTCHRQPNPLVVWSRDEVGFLRRNPIRTTSLATLWLASLPRKRAE